MRTESPATGITIPPRPARPPVAGKEPAKGESGAAPVSRAGTIWAATVAALVVLSLLIVFILQNQERVRVQYLGLSGSLPLGVGLFIAAVAGGLMVAAVGAVRITQLRKAANQAQHRGTVPHAGAIPRALRRRPRGK